MPGMSQRHSYDLDNLDARAEIERLHKQVDLVRELEKQYLSRTGLPPDANVVDLGCGPGRVSEILCELFPDGRVYGLDVDLKLLRRATTLLRSSGHDHGRFVQTWADKLPIADRSVDLVYSRFLFQHLADPMAALSEAVRIGKPGGWMVILDSDDGSLLVYPEPEGFQRLLEASHVSQARVEGDRHVGRKLRSYMVRAGLEDVELVPVPFTSDMVGMRSFLDVTVGFKHQIVAEDLMTPEEVQTVIDDLYALADVPGAIGLTLGYVCYGRFPGRR